MCSDLLWKPKKWKFFGVVVYLFFLCCFYNHLAKSLLTLVLISEFLICQFWDHYYVRMLWYTDTATNRRGYEITYVNTKNNSTKISIQVPNANAHMPPLVCNLNLYCNPKSQEWNHVILSNLEHVRLVHLWTRHLLV